MPSIVPGAFHAVSIPSNIQLSSNMLPVPTRGKSNAPKFRLSTKKLIVFRQPLTPPWSAGLDPRCYWSDRQGRQWNCPRFRVVDHFPWPSTKPLSIIMASIVSSIEPIWFIFGNRAMQAFSSINSFNILGFVRKRSSQTTCQTFLFWLWCCPSRLDQTNILPW